MFREEYVKDEFKMLVNRYARATDSEKMMEIAKAVNVHSLDYFKQGKGFLVQSLSKDEYLKRILEDNRIMVLEFDKNVVGFICGFTSESIDILIEKTVLGHELNIIKKMNQIAFENHINRYIFLDQIAIDPNFQGKGFGRQLFLHYIDITGGHFFAAMLEKPIINPRINYWLEYGFMYMGSVEQVLDQRFHPDAPPLNTGSLTWGIYYFNKEAKL